MVNWPIVFSALLSVFLLLHLFMCVACWCAMYHRFRYTDMEHKRHVRIMTRALVALMYRNAYTSNGTDYDVLVEMVAGFYLFGYTAGSKAMPPEGLNPYVRQHKVLRPFYKQIIHLTQNAYRVGEEDAQCRNVA